MSKIKGSTKSTTNSRKRAAKNDGLTQADAKRIISQIERSELTSALIQGEANYGYEMRRDTQGLMARRHRSFRHNYYNSTKPVMTDWASEVNWPRLHKDLMGWVEQNMTTPLVEDMAAYVRSTLDFHLSFYFPTQFVEQFMTYGYNQGRKEPDQMKSLIDKMRPLAQSFPWYDMPKSWFQIDNSIETYDDLLLRYPYMTVINTSSTTGYPYYKRQTPEMIMKVWKDGFRRKDLVISMYRRMQGAKKSDSKPKPWMSNINQIKYKIRTVYGGPWSAKVKGAPLTYSWQHGEWIDPDTKKPISPYYQDGKAVFDEILSWYKGLKNDQVIFTSDQTGFDVNHDKTIIDAVKSVVAPTVPSTYKPWWNYLTEVSGSPQCWYYFTGTHRVKRGIHLRVSGSSDIPMEETLLNVALHKEGFEFENYFCQIDDFVGVTHSDDIYRDLDLWSAKTKDELGFIINPDKTESSERGYVVFLQMYMGEILKDSDLTYMGHPFRRVHRLRYRERRSKVEGELWADGERVDDNVQRFIDSFGSLGPNTPESMLEVILQHFKGSSILKEALQWSAIEPSKWIATDKEWGINNKWFIKYLSDLMPSSLRF